jgi:hypothetical protein
LLSVAADQRASAPPALAAADPAGPINPSATPAGGPLAGLVKLLNPTAPVPDGRPVVQPGDATTRLAPAELRTLQQHRRTWAQLRIDRQLAGAESLVPEQAGPLHSDRLVLRALQQMRALSPAYLGHFAVHVDTLLWLEQTAPSAAPPPGKPARKDGERQRKPGRGKAG